MGIIRFKSIAKEPLPPPAPKKKVADDMGIEWPSREKIAKMTADEAYAAGQTFGDAILAAKKLGVPVASLMTKNVTANQTSANCTPPSITTIPKLTDIVTTLYKKSDTGIGYKQWSIYVRSGNSVIIEWGHCDKAKQEKVYPFVNRPHLMEQWMREAISGKIKKGYSRTK